MGAPFRHWLYRALLLLAVILSVVGIVFLPIPLGWRFALFAAEAIAGYLAAFRLVPAFDPFGRMRRRVPGGLKRCAITFDDGPSAATAKVLDILAAEGVPATFFVLGNHVERYPDVVRRAQAEGHAVGVHGMSHRRLAGAGEDAIEEQIAGVTGALERLGVTPAPVYRTPHGFKSPGVFEVARRRGLTLWAWTRGVWDTDRPAPAVLVRRATRMARAGMVLLLHDGRGDELNPDVTPMLAALPQVLRELKRRGFAFVRVADV